MTDNKKDTVTLDDEQWMELFERTDGEIARCYQCGTCTATCPWGAMNGDGDPLPVRDLMRRSQLGVNGAGEELYRCLTCKACEAGCPRGVDITEVILRLREAVFDEQGAPGELEKALWSVYEEDNPWERPTSNRGDWMEELPDDTELSVQEEAQVLFYVGCAPSYDPALQEIPVSIVQLLQAAEVDMTVLGQDEVCCGDVIRQTGEPDFFNQLSEQNAEKFGGIGAELIVTISPHCADTFRKAYDLDADVVHYTEYLDALYQHDRLVFENLERTVTYHDPCYLARGLDVIGPPRKLLGAAGVNVDEMNQAGTDTFCCGGGGGQMWQESDMDERFSERRVKHAGETEAQELITSCPYCIQMLRDGIKTTDVDLPVRDLATLLLDAHDPDAEITGDTEDDLVVEVQTEEASSTTETSPSSPDQIESPAPTLEYIPAVGTNGSGKGASSKPTEMSPGNRSREKSDEEQSSSEEKSSPHPVLPEGVSEMELLEAWNECMRPSCICSQYVKKHVFGDEG